MLFRVGHQLCRRHQREHRVWFAWQLHKESPLYPDEMNNKHLHSILDRILFHRLLGDIFCHMAHFIWPISYGDREKIPNYSLSAIFGGGSTEVNWRPLEVNLYPVPFQLVCHFPFLVTFACLTILKRQLKVLSLFLI